MVKWDANGDAVDSGYTVTNSDSLGTSDTTLATQGNVKAYADSVANNPLRGYNDLSHSTTSNTIIQNTTGRPLFVSFGLSSSNDINQLDLRISVNSDMSSSNLISQFQIMSDAAGDSKATVTGIVPANYYWRVTHESTSEESMQHRSFQL